MKENELKQFIFIQVSAKPGEHTLGHYLKYSPVPHLYNIKIMVPLTKMQNTTMAQHTDGVVFQQKQPEVKALEQREPKVKVMTLDPTAESKPD